MPELAPNDPAGATDEAEGKEPVGEHPSSQPEHAEPTEQPDEEDEPQAGSPS